jgi:hypothetical protein
MLKTTRVSTLAVVVALHTGLLVSGCSGHAESVLEQQNRLSTALMHAIFTAETEGAEDAQPLYEAEARLKKACAPMNRAAYLKMNQQEVDSATGFAVMSKLDDCEQTAADTEKLLWQMDPEAARYFLGEMEAAADKI